ncbi:MAG: GNAT family N-acetyltransferase [Caldisphaeraceae archaeon]|nr:GNAT family N-acetyltransferase [Caldisphaeraceae archaeon]
MSSVVAEYSFNESKYLFKYAPPEYKEKIVEFYSSMDDESIYYRFLSFFKDFESHVEKIFGEKNRLGFAMVCEDEGGEVVAVGETFSFNPNISELAFIVKPEHRKRGLGTIMGALLVLGAHKRGIKQMEAYFHVDNEPAYRIGVKLGLKMKFEEDVYHGKAPIGEIYRIALENLREKGVRLFDENV